MEQTAEHEQLSWAANAVVTLVNRTMTVSFVEIESMLASRVETKGDRAMCIPDYPNIILWANMSEAFVAAMSEALGSRQIECRPTSMMVYLLDGGVLDMPIAKAPRQYKEPHWLPVVWNPQKEDVSTKKRRSGKRK